MDTQRKFKEQTALDIIDSVNEQLKKAEELGFLKSYFLVTRRDDPEGDAEGVGSHSLKGNGADIMLSIIAAMDSDDDIRQLIESTVKIRNIGLKLKGLIE